MPASKKRQDAREVFAQNLASLMDWHDVLRTQTAIGRRTGLKQSTISRAAAGKHAVTLSTLEAIAAAYGLEPWQLLVPGLDPRNPPVYLSAQERQLYERMRAAAAQIASK